MEEIVLYLKLSLSAYIITLVITSSSIFKPFRTILKRVTPFMQIQGHPHFIECSLCVTFWVSLGLTLWFTSFTDTFAVYGLAYFLATQEK